MASVTIDRTSKVTVALAAACVVFVAGATYGIGVRDTRLVHLEKRVSEIDKAMPRIIRQLDRICDRMGISVDSEPYTNTWGSTRDDQ